MNDKKPHDSFDENFDEYDYEPYGEYDDSFSLTGDDDMPLTSASDSYDDDFSEPSEPSRGRTSSRRETINRIASEQKNGKKNLTYGPLSSMPDPRVNSARGRSTSSNRSRQPAGGYRNTVRSQSSARLNRAEKREDTAQKAKKRKSRFAAFYIVFALLAVGSGLTLLLMFSQQWMENPMAALTANNPTPAPTPGPMIGGTRPDMRSQTALVTNITNHGGNRTISLMDVSTRRDHDFVVDDSVRVSNRLGNAMTFSEIQVGNLIDIQFDASTNTIRTIDESRGAWERRNRSNVHVNIADGTIALGNEIFNFNSQTLVLHRGTNFPIMQIRPVDSVTLAGVGDTAWLVRLDASHGFLELTNTDMIVGGTIMIGTNLFFALDDITEPITLTEGIHRVVIEGSNIEPFIDNITIEQGRTSVINLGQTTPRRGLLHIFVLPNDADVLVNGEPHDITQPIEVDFGEVHVRVERNGYMPQEETFEVNMPITQRTFELEEILVDSTLILWTVPTNAEVYIDNVFMGFTTLTLTVPPGTHNLILRMNGFNDVHDTIEVLPDEEISRSWLLTPNISDPLDGLEPPEVDPVLPGAGTEPPTTTDPPELPTLPPENPFPGDDD